MNSTGNYNAGPTVERYVVIQEFFMKRDDGVWRLWRFAGEKEWREEKTPYLDLPLFYNIPK